MDLFLLETEEDIHQFKNEIEKMEQSNLIALSTKTHKILKKTCISHEIIDDYFSKSDYDKIDTIIINYSLNWYKQKGIKLEIDGLNLGYLLETEISHYFLTLVRLVIGIKKIIEEKNPTKLFVGSIAPIVKAIVANKKILIIEKKIDKKLGLDRDEIEIPIPIARTRKIKISRKHFIKIKNIIEKISSQSIKKRKFSNKTILLLDFNPVFYKELLTNFSEKFDQVFLLNQRRPAIWNLQSLKIIRQTGCEILRLEDFNDSDTKKEIKIKIEESKRKINEIRNDSSLKEFFKIDEIILWDIIEEKLIEILLDRSQEMISRNIMIKNFFESIPISIVFEWSYKGFEERIVNHQAIKKNIPIAFLQHSIIVEDPKFDIFLPFQPTLPDKESKIAVYGNSSFNFVRNKGVSDNQILTTGSPRHDEFFKAKKFVKNENYIVIATASTFPKYKADGNDIRSYDKLEKIIEKLLIAIKKYPNKKSIIKLHPRKDYDDIMSYIREIDKNVPIYWDQKSIDVIKNCDVLISTNFSTILLEGMILGKPTIMISNENFQNEPIVKENATMFVSKMDEIENALKKLLTDNKFRNELITNANNYIDKYFSHQGEASKFVAKELAEI